MSSSAGSGKDTVADYIVEKLHNGNAVKHSLGSSIHELAEQFATEKVERHHLQDLGESVRSIFGHETWIHLLDKETKDLNVPLIIPDVRKLLEYSHYCVERGFKPLYVYTSSDVAKARLNDRDGGFKQSDLERNIELQMTFLQDETMNTIVNNGLCKIDMPYPFNEIYVVNNSGALDKTYRQLDDWWEIINEK